MLDAFIELKNDHFDTKYTCIMNLYDIELRISSEVHKLVEIILREHIHSPALIHIIELQSDELMKYILHCIMKIQYEIMTQ